MESSQFQIDVYQISEVNNNYVEILEDNSKIDVQFSNGFLVLKGIKNRFQCIFSMNRHILIISDNEKQIKVYIISNECQNSHYSIVVGIENGQIDTFDQILNNHSDLTYQEGLEDGQQVYIKTCISKNQRKVCELGDKVREVIIDSGVLFGKVVYIGGKKVIEHIDKSDQEMKVNPLISDTLKTVNKGTKAMFDFTKQALHRIGDVIQDKIVKKDNERKIEQLDQEQEEKKKTNLEKIADNQSVRTAVHVVSGVYDGMVIAGDAVFNNFRKVSKEGVHKKYGKQAGDAVDDGLGIVNNIKDLKKVHRHVAREQVLETAQKINK